MKTRVRLIKNGSKDTGALIGDTGFIEQIVYSPNLGDFEAIVCLDKNKRFVSLRIEKLEQIGQNEDRPTISH